jgi:type III secretion system low calcium response chaperone LcrH/SycD
MDDSFIQDLMRVGEPAFGTDYSFPLFEPDILLEFFSEGRKERATIWAEQENIWLEATRTLMASKGYLKGKLQFPDEQVEVIYNHAYRAFSDQNYTLAFELFRLLVFLQPLEHRFLYALGRSLQGLEYYFLAVRAYKMAQAVKQEDPTASFCAGECFWAMGDIASALTCIEHVLVLAQKDKTFSALGSRAALEFEAIQEQLKQQSKKVAVP